MFGSQAPANTLIYLNGTAMASLRRCGGADTFEKYPLHLWRCSQNLWKPRKIQKYRRCSFLHTETLNPVLISIRHKNALGIVCMSSCRAGKSLDAVHLDETFSLSQNLQLKTDTLSQKVAFFW